MIQYQNEKREKLIRPTIRFYTFSSLIRGFPITISSPLS